MAKPTDSDAARPRVVLHGAEGPQLPALVVHVLDAEGKVLGSAPVEPDGSFPSKMPALGKAATVLVGPAGANPERRRGFYAVPASELAEIIRTGGELAIAPAVWRPWCKFRRCVSGNVRRCFPYLDVIDDLLVDTGLAQLQAVRKLVGLRPLARLPLHRCSPLCFGTVEVYRRVCCCTPPFDLGDVFDDLPVEIEPDFPWPPEGPRGPIGPIGPGPDPAPFELQQLVLTGGALDERKVQFARARAELPRLEGRARSEFIRLHPYLWCHCSFPVKVGEGFIQDGGAFSVCWNAPILPLPSNCREEFAYVVKQPIGGSMVAVYDGVAAHQWFDASDEPMLTSYSRLAVGCRDTDVPGTGAFVVLEDIGSTPSHLLATPAQDSALSVGAPGYNSGLLNPVADPADAVGQLRNRNLGGDVALQYHFTESMKAAGARFYRVQVAAANAAGDPVGGWTPLPSPTWSTWHLGTATPGSIALGPNPAVGPNLSKIPYDTGDPLAPDEEWQDGQFHAVIPTAGGAFPEGRYLVGIEVFNAAGVRLKPAAAPAAEAGTVAPFSFRRWNLPASTVAVPFAALTHMMWWDNRRAEADIVDIRLGGVPSEEECQFLEGPAGAGVEIGYRAYHPQPGTPSFLHDHSLVITRGLNGGSFQVANLPGDEVGEPPAGVHTSVAKSLAQLLDGHAKCAFAVELEAHVKTTNGAGTLTGLNDKETAAFAAEIV